MRGALLGLQRPQPGPSRRAKSCRPAATASPRRWRRRRRSSRSPRPRCCLAASADCLDEIPFAHLGASGNPLTLRDLVELLAVPVLEPVARLAATLASPRGLLSELAPRRLRHPRDGALAARAALSLLHVAPGGLPLLRGRHLAHLRIEFLDRMPDS